MEQEAYKARVAGYYIHCKCNSSITLGRCLIEGMDKIAGAMFSTSATYLL